MKKFDEMKGQILKEFPSVKMLPFTKRVKAFFLEKSKHTLTIESDDRVQIWKQHATLVCVDGSFYTYCWGFEERR